MKSIIFICQGNICRSPMAEFILKDKLKKLNLLSSFKVTSAALESSTFDEDMDDRAKEQLNKHNIPFTKHSAHQLTIPEFMAADYVIVMEKYQKILIKRMLNSSKNLHKVERLLHYSDIDKDIIDPYFFHNFEEAYNNIEKGIDGLIEKELIPNN